MDRPSPAPIPRLALAALLLAGAALPGGCEPDEPLDAPPPPLLVVGLDVSRAAGRGGALVAVAIRAEAGNADPIAAIQGTLRFDPTRLRYVGQAEDAPGLVLVEGAGAGRGELGVLALDLAGLARRPVTLVFEVLAKGHTRGLRFVPALAVTRGMAALRTMDVAAAPSRAGDLKVPSRVTRRSPADWERSMAPMVAEPAGAGGGPVHGDATGDGVVDRRDAVRLARLALAGAAGEPSAEAVSVAIVDVWPAIRAGSGGTAGASRSPERPVVDLLDVLAVALEAAGWDLPLIGEPVGLREPPAGSPVDSLAGD